MRTDHSALTWLLSFRNLEGQTGRWVQRPQEYNFTSEHRKGIRHTNADALSRRPCSEGCSHCQKLELRSGEPRVRIVFTAPADGWDQQALRTEQLANNDLGPLIQEIETGRHPEWRDISNLGPNLQELLGPVEIPLIDGRRVGALLGVGRWEKEDGPSSRPSRQSG